MKELYRRVRHLDMNKENEMITITAGALAGHHILFTDGAQVYTTGPDYADIQDQVKPDQIFRERLTQSIQLVVCGCGFVGQSVIRLGKFLGWNVTALDDRQEYVMMAEEAGADRVLCADFESSLRPFQSGEATCFVIVTREHQFDKICLNQIMGKPFGYVGMMGSHRRAAMVRETLISEGVSKERVDLLCAPVGLAIGAQTPEEIAVSIIAQIMQKRSASQSGSSIPDVVMDALRKLEAGSGRAVMAVVISKNGSAPRDPGARMLIYPDSHTVGTIGGGLMEAEVIRRAVSALESPSFVPETITVDLSGKKGEPAGMQCGGVTEVFLEIL